MLVATIGCDRDRDVIDIGGTTTTSLVTGVKVISWMVASGCSWIDGWHVSVVDAEELEVMAVIRASAFKS